MADHSQTSEITAVRRDKAAALDVGRARIGLALTDDRVEVAQAWQVVERRGTRLDIQQILQLAQRQGLRVWVVGWPPQDGGADRSAQLARGFAQALADAQPLPVWLVDEADSTQEAHQDLRQLGMSAAKRRREVDKHAAKVILDRWLAGAAAQRVAPSSDPSAPGPEAVDASAGAGGSSRP